MPPGSNAEAFDPLFTEKHPVALYGAHRLPDTAAAIPATLRSKIVNVPPAYSYLVGMVCQCSDLAATDHGRHAIAFVSPLRA
jgi:hypothetical protein